jgi:para-nitrobenzyl esterase
MISYWTTFARTGNPNHAGAPKWSAGTAHGRLQLVPNQIQPVDAAAEHQCGFWSTIR